MACWPNTLVAQESGAGGEAKLGPRQILPLAEEIALARSAAPAAVSDSATVYVFTPNGYEVAEPGTSGVTCYVGRSWPESREPHCFDQEGAATILAIHMREVELMHLGVARSDIDREINDGIVTGTFRLPARPAMSWMMSSAQELINDEGQAAGAWKPHLMIYYPYLSAEGLGLGGPPDLRHAILVSGDHATSNLMIVVAEAIDPKPVTRSSR